MPNLSIQMTEAELFALDMIAVNKQEWAENVLTNRARVAAQELQTTPEWSQAVALVAQAGGDVSNVWLVLLTGRDATPPLFETLAVVSAREEAAAALSTPEAPVIADAAAPVLAHALALKIGLVNATRTDGGPDYPVSPEALAGIRQTYSDIVSELTAKTTLGDTLTTQEQGTLRLILNGFEAFKGIDFVAQAIIAAGDAVDPIASDPRWPTLGA